MEEFAQSRQINGCFKFALISVDRYYGPPTIGAGVEAEIRSIPSERDTVNMSFRKGFKHPKNWEFAFLCILAEKCDHSLRGRIVNHPFDAAADHLGEI